MRIVIPVADEPNNPSLPYALASIRKHTDLEPLTVGMKDYGLCDHLRTVEPGGKLRKFTGEPIAMRTAIDHLGEPFIWSNDDIYWLRPAEPIRWAIGDLTDDHTHTIYQQRKHRTWQTCKTYGLPTWDYESHTPLPVTDLNAMLLALNMPGTMRSLYGNLTGEPDVIAADVKVRSRRDPVPDAPWASTEGRPNTWPALMERL